MTHENPGPGDVPGGRAAPGISVVAAAIVEEGRLLLVSKKAAPDVFYLPGGKPEPGESAEETLLRELDEELGVTPADLVPLGTVDDVAALENVPMRLTLFRATLAQVPRPAAELARLHWLDAEGPAPVRLAPAITRHVLPLLTAAGAVLGGTAWPRGRRTTGSTTPGVRPARPLAPTRPLPHTGDPAGARQDGAAQQGTTEGAAGRGRRGMRVALESRRTRAALTLLAGSLPALTFPAPALWWLAPVALVPWLLLARSARTPRGAALTGWLGGTGYMLAVHHWLLPSLHIFILVLAALLGLLWAPWGWTVRRLLRGRPGPASFAAAVFLLPAAWLLAELVRSWEYLGGPWGLFGASQWQVAPALRLVSVGGVWLVSFLLVAVNTCVAALVAVPTARRGAVTGLVGAAVVVGSVSMWAPRPERTGELRVAVVQPGALKTPQKRLERSEELTRKLADSSPDLVVWGESSVGYDLGAKPELRKRLAALSAEVGSDLLVNVDARRKDAAGISKTSVLIGPGGPVGEHYDKMRLVPFGEYVPARQVLGWATSVGKAADEDRVRGTEPVLMEADGTVFGPLICFETAFPDMSRHLVREGARLLVAQTATGTFQDSWAPQQHASLAALRAAETGRPMVHGTLTGVSAVYGPRGEPVGERLGTDRDAASVYTVPLASGTTLYVRFGDWILQLAMTALVAFFAAEAVRTLRSRHNDPERGSGPGPEPYAEDAPSYAGAAAMRRNRRP